MLKTKELREEFARLHGEATAIIEAAATEKRELKDEEKTANDTRFARMNQIKQAMDEHTRFAALAFEKAAEEGAEGEPSIQLSKDAPGRAEYEASKPDGQGMKFTKEQIRDAFNRWASTGDMDRKFATITTATASGALLPKEIGAPVVPTSSNAIRQAMAIYGVPAINTDKSSALTVPVIDASAGGQVAENASSETENAPSLAESIDLSVKTYQSGSAWFSNLQLGATDFDIVAYAQTALAYSKELGLEAALVAALIADSGITQSVTTDATTGITYANLVDLNMALPKKYDQQKAILLSKTAFAAATKLVGDDGHPVLNVDPQNQSLVRFNGTPVIRCDNFDALGASKTIGATFSLLG
jgi:HK97 family phage major capsid protein